MGQVVLFKAVILLQLLVMIFMGQSEARVVKRGGCCNSAKECLQRNCYSIIGKRLSSSNMWDTLEISDEEPPSQSLSSEDSERLKALLLLKILQDTQGSIS
ncbi:hypothetical protein HOLleu_33825 [Holothuria leucospilota]|uniref:Uncharacterized protein n=1 Tax=Holothuria leucospilota TaxID=206669 RepID=A0A9Q0YTV0_HOLLE|nr:hypothetical protein HOLleu_33825 [Holothuria leucospilota]